MKGIVIFLVGPAAGGSTLHDESYVVDYQPEFWATNDYPWLATSRDIAKARVFPSITEAHAYWRQTPPAPDDVRPDGRPNRPLTGFTVVMEPVIVDEADA